MRCVCVAKQPHILAGLENKIAIGAIASQNANIPVFVVRMPYQNSQAAVRIEIGKFRITLNACTQAYRHDTVIFALIVVGSNFDAAVNLLAVVNAIGQENAERILCALQRNAFSAISFYHRRIDLHARRFLNGAARMNHQFIICSLQKYRIIRIQLFGFFISGGNVAIDGNISADRGKFHVVSCRNLAIILQTSVRFQRNIAFGVRSIALRLKFRADLEHAFGFFVFYYYVSIDHGLNGQRQLVCAVQY